MDIKIVFILNQHCVPYIIFCSILEAASYTCINLTILKHVKTYTNKQNKKHYFRTIDIKFLIRNKFIVTICKGLQQTLHCIYMIDIQ